MFLIINTVHQLLVSAPLTVKLRVAPGLELSAMLNMATCIFKNLYRNEWHYSSNSRPITCSIIKLGMLPPFRSTHNMYVHFIFKKKSNLICIDWHEPTLANLIYLYVYDWHKKS